MEGCSKWTLVIDGVVRMSRTKKLIKIWSHWSVFVILFWGVGCDCGGKQQCFLSVISIISFTCTLQRTELKVSSRRTRFAHIYFSISICNSFSTRTYTHTHTDAHTRAQAWKNKDNYMDQTLHLEVKISRAPCLLCKMISY